MYDVNELLIRALIGTIEGLEIQVARYQARLENIHSWDSLSEEIIQRNPDMDWYDIKDRHRYFHTLQRIQSAMEVWF